MKNSEQNGSENKKNPIVIFTTVGFFAITVIAAAFYTLNYLKKKKEEANLAAPQEQFVGQVGTSAALQAECQKSASSVVSQKSIKDAFSEFKQNVESCREVYFSMDEKVPFRNEGMYPDLLLDLIKISTKEDINFANELLVYGKSIGNWQMYMGPIVCESTQVLSAFEESLSNTAPQKCVGLSEGQADLFQQLKLKNLNILDSYLPKAQVAFLSSTEAGLACPENLSEIKTTLKKVLQDADIVGEARPEQVDGSQLSLLFQSKSDEDKLLLQFKMNGQCLQFDSALIPGLSTNE